MFRGLSSKAASPIGTLLKHNSPRRSNLCPHMAFHNQPFMLQYYPLHARYFSADRRSSKRSPEAARDSPSFVFLQKVRQDRIPKSLICQRVEELLLQMVTQKQKPANGPISLDLLNVAIANADLPKERLIPRLFSLACQIMVTSNHPLALKEVQRQIWRLLDNHRDFLTEDLLYNSHHVNDACAQFINTVVVDSNKSKRDLSKEYRVTVEKLISRLHNLYDDPTVALVANVDSYSAFIIFLCNQGRPREAYDNLKWMVKTSNQHPVDIAPRVMNFTATISAFAKTEPEKSMEAIQWMLDQYRAASSRIPAPNASCFNGLLDAVARSGRNDSGRRAEQTLDWMQQLHDTEGLDTMPTGISYNCCINAWANTPHPDSPRRADSILRKMIALHENGSDVVPSNFSFISAMNAWANAGLPEAPQQISNLLNEMKTLSTEITGITVDSYAYAVLIKGLENIDRKRLTEREKEKYILEVLTTLYQMEREGVRVTPAIHNSVIMALANFSLLTATLYFQELEERYRQGETVVDVRTFNTGLSVMALLNKADVAEKSVDILNRMEQYSNTDPSIKPNQTTFNVILKVWSRSHSPDAANKADETLCAMEQMRSFKTSTASYVTVIIAWGRSNDEYKFDKVKQLLKRYQNAVTDGIVTDPSSPYVFNAVLSVCRHNTDETLNAKSLDVALYTLDKLRKTKSLKPDETTYLTMFQVFRRLFDQDPSRLAAIIEKEFARCIGDGLLSRGILEELHATSRDIFENILEAEVGKSPKDVKIPPRWSRRSRSKDAPI